MKNPATLFALKCEVPKTTLSQDSFSSAIKEHLSLDDKEARFLKLIARGSQIKKRHTVITDFLENGLQGSFFGLDKTQPLPKTGMRNERFKEEAPKLAESVCRKTLKEWGRDPQAITHVISVSCTGMIAPGIEFLLIDQLGLSPDIERLGINFMGCFGAFKGLAIAKALALENPNHRILVVCTELCSLHFQNDRKIDTAVANALFADGAAAVIVGTNPTREELPLVEIHNQGSTSLKNSKELMSWDAGDHGYEMRLDPSVPHHLEKNIFPFAERILGKNLTFEECAWAVHPGGKAILQAIEKGCNLEKSQLAPSWKVMEEYGNMSSPTFLFVLQELLRSSCQKRWVIGLGFGPGLSVEGLLLKRSDSHVAK